MPGRGNEISQDLREIIIRMVISEGRSRREVSRDLGIPKTTIVHIVNRYTSMGTSLPGRRGGSRTATFRDEINTQIIRLINDNTTHTVEEIQTQLGVQVSLTTVWRWVKSLGFTYKITRPIYELRNEASTKLQRQSYVRWYNQLPHPYRYNNLIYIDESPFNLHMLRSHSWAQRGRTPNPIIRPRGRNITMILAVSSSNLIHCEAIFSSVNADIFTSFMQQVIRIIGRDEAFTFVMDNVNFHHTTANMIEDTVHEIKFLPKYSPFLNPCEEVFSMIKSNVRRQTPPNGEQDLIQRMLEACTLVSTNNLSNFVSHCEQFFEKCLLLVDVPRE